jgi:hypothetical protein
MSSPLSGSVLDFVATRPGANLSEHPRMLASVPKIKNEAKWSAVRRNTRPQVQITQFQVALKASATWSLAARIAGNKPLTNPSVIVGAF